MAISATPIPVLARARESSFWQKHWRETISDAEFPGYAQATDLKKWFAQQVASLAPGSVLEFGCNVGANLREIGVLCPATQLYGIELNERAIAWSKANGVAPTARFVCGSMGDAEALMQGIGVDQVDVVFTSAAAMHCDDAIFASAKAAALKVARRAIVHMEFNAWSPADLQNARNWRSSFLSDRWIRDYPGEYSGHHRVERIETIGVPLAINYVDSIGRLLVSDVNGLVVVHLKPG
ncbi:methyltransferase domain-containing protein [Bradyrhizobium lablabi]|uniref:methyltransferase domain-containing protein n=1 Tax=Bradyrhizobium lablabi TaxID=722472 RepID=UPI001BAD5325|nr:methyltransferase domain-containing protein [Bradyrhizobium lablabi]MBR0695913.1 methyltransferase domain-containing protein [Bradyrhizobium lablabi]